MNIRAEANRLLGCIRMDEESLRQEITASLEAARAAGAEQAVNETQMKGQEDEC